MMKEVRIEIISQSDDNNEDMNRFIDNLPEFERMFKVMIAHYKEEFPDINMFINVEMR